MDTDVTTAQSFDASSFFGNLLQTAGNVYVASTKTTQNTGVPAATTTPNLVARNTGVVGPAATGGISQNQIMIGLGVIAVIVVVLALRK